MKCALGLYAGLLLVLLAVAPGQAAFAAELEGVTMAETANVGGQALALNGLGLRTRFGFRVYVAGLYLAAKSNDAATVLAAPGAKRVVFALKRNVGAETFAKALAEGVRENTAPEQLSVLKERMERLDALILSLKEVKEGDLVQFDFSPGTGTTVTHNGKLVGEAIAGDDFYRAVLGVFLGSKPVQESLKSGLLGKAG
jgi:hypothetical protein